MARNSHYYFCVENSDFEYTFDFCFKIENNNSSNMLGSCNIKFKEKIAISCEFY